jgi:asparagine synthase (glutamine-hydrolysing)
MRSRGRDGKYILREAVGNSLPPMVTKRRKLGFNPPMALWLKEDLQELVKDCLSEESIRDRGIFEWKAVGSMLDLHASGRRDVSLQIWSLVVFETWQRMYMDQSTCN